MSREARARSVVWFSNQRRGFQDDRRAWSPTVLARGHPSCSFRQFTQKAQTPCFLSAQTPTRLLSMMLVPPTTLSYLAGVPGNDSCSAGESSRVRGREIWGPCLSPSRPCEPPGEAGVWTRDGGGGDGLAGGTLIAPTIMVGTALEQ